MRLPLILILLSAFPTFCWGNDRAIVHLFQYGGANAPNSITAFLNFRDLMIEKLPRLASELLSTDTRGVALAGLDALELKPVISATGQNLESPSVRIPNLAQRRLYWNDTGALALLTGRVEERDSGALSIRSTFFFGELGKTLGRETLDVELPFTSDVYDTTNDSHSVIVLFALAMETLKLVPNDIAAGCNLQSRVYFLLNEAHLRAKAVGRDDSQLGAALEHIVEEAFDKIEAVCPA